MLTLVSNGLYARSRLVLSCVAMQSLSCRVDSKVEQKQQKALAHERNILAELDRHARAIMWKQDAISSLRFVLGVSL